MDIVFLTVAVGFWLAVVGLAIGCERLQGRKVSR